MLKRSVLLIVFAVSFLISQSIAHSVEYTIVDLGMMGGKTAAAKAINNGGQVAGVSTDNDDFASVFIYQDGVVIALSSPGCDNVDVRDINRKGVIAGVCHTDDEGAKAAIWDGEMELLEAPNWILWTAGGINRQGLIVGSGASPDDESRAFLRTKGKTAELKTPRGYSSWAVDVNNRGHVAGVITSPKGHYEAVLWTGGRLRRLPVPDGLDAQAVALDYGLKAAGHYIRDGVTHACLWTNERFTDLGSLGGGESLASGINGNGQVVGRSKNLSGETHAFVWQDGVMQDLGTLDGPYPYSVAEDVNNHGWIVGSAIGSDGNLHAVMWVPQSDDSQEK